jgi:hypothetical protein
MTVKSPGQRATFASVYVEHGADSDACRRQQRVVCGCNSLASVLTERDDCIHCQNVVSLALGDGLEVQQKDTGHILASLTFYT